MKKWLAVAFFGVLVGPVSAATLDLERNVEVLIINQEEVEEVPHELKAGENQLVLRYEGRIKGKSKSVHITSKPYIVVTSANKDQNISISFIPNTEDKFERAVNEGTSLFEIKVDGIHVDSLETLLPPRKGLFPYSKPDELIANYNSKHGLIFDSGKIRSLKEELASVQTGAVVGATVATDSTVQESENTLQLKLWYSRASEEERKAFQKWLIDQK